MDDNKKAERPVGTGKRWFRPSVIDIGIILLAILSIVAIVLRVTDARNTVQELQKRPSYDVYFTVEETHRRVLEELTGHELVYLYENDVCIGYIARVMDHDTGEMNAAISISPAPGATGNDRVIATGHMTTEGAELKNGALLISGSGVHITPGTCLEVRTERVYMKIRITGIRAR